MADESTVEKELTSGQYFDEIKARKHEATDVYLESPPTPIITKEDNQ